MVRWTGVNRCAVGSPKPVPSRSGSRVPSGSSAGGVFSHAAQNVAHLRDHPQPTLTDLPVRLFLAAMGRVGPDPTVVAKDLERLFGGGGSAAPAAAPDASAPGLDFSKPG